MERGAWCRKKADVGKRRKGVVMKTLSGGPRRSRWSRPLRELASQRFLILVLAGLAVAMVVLLILLKNYELLQTTPISGGVTEYKIRLFQRFDIYLKNEVKPTPDVFNSAILISISSMALFALLFLERAQAHVSRSLRWFFVSVWLGFGYLAADELIAIHETIGRNLNFLADIPGVEKADNVVFTLYVIPVVVFLVVFRRILFSSSTATAFIALGVVFFLAGVVADEIEIGQAEDFIEILGATSFLMGFAIVMIDSLLAAVLVETPGIPG